MPTPAASAPDDLPRSGVADPPLSLSAQSPGHSGGSGKLGLALIALGVLVAVVAVLWFASHQGERHPPAGMGAAVGAASVAPSRAAFPKG